jgi:hypothetical protein
MSRRQEVLVFAVAAVLVVVAAFLLLIRPQRDAAARARADEHGAVADSQSLQNQIRALEALKANAASLQAQAKQARGQFPATPDLPDLVDALQDVAKESGVDLAQVSPAAPKTSPIGPELAVIDTSLTVTGGYFQVEDFLSRLENLIKGADPVRVPPRSMLVRSVILGSGAAAGAASAGTAGPPDQLQATIALSVFQLTQSPSASAGGGTQVR